MKRDSEHPHLVRWNDHDPYVIEPHDVGRKIPEFCTVKVIGAEHVGRYLWRRDGKAWVESDAAYQQRTAKAGAK